MGKIIIHNHSGLPDYEAIRYVSVVMKAGRISNNNTQYCYHTTFKDGTEVSCDLNDKSDRFTVFKARR